jgi:hypothetical protein
MENQEQILVRLETQQLPKFMKCMFYIAMISSLSLRIPYELPDAVFNQYDALIERFGKNLKVALMEVLTKVGNTFQSQKESLFTKKNTEIAVIFVFEEQELYQSHRKRY